MIRAFPQDPSIVTPAPGSVGDPTLAGATLRLVNPTTLESATFALPGGAAWTARVTPSGALGYLYQDRSGTDGTTIQVLRGHKQSGDLSSAFGGTLTVVKGKKGGALKGTVQGLDLGALTGSVTVTLVVDGVEVSKSVAVKGSGNTRKFK